MRRRTPVLIIGPLLAVLLVVEGVYWWKQKAWTCAFLDRDIDNAYDRLDSSEADGDEGGVADANRDLRHAFLSYKDEGCGSIPPGYDTDRNRTSGQAHLL